MSLFAAKPSQRNRTMNQKRSAGNASVNKTVIHTNLLVSLIIMWQSQVLNETYCAAKPLIRNWKVSYTCCYTYHQFESYQLHTV